MRFNDIASFRYRHGCLVAVVEEMYVELHYAVDIRTPRHFRIARHDLSGTANENASVHFVARCL